MIALPAGVYLVLANQQATTTVRPAREAGTKRSSVTGEGV